MPLSFFLQMVFLEDLLSLAFMRNRLASDNFQKIALIRWMKI